MEMQDCYGQLASFIFINGTEKLEFNIYPTDAYVVKEVLAQKLCKERSLV